MISFEYEGVKYESPLSADAAYQLDGFGLEDGRYLVATWTETAPPRVVSVSEIEYRVLRERLGRDALLVRVTRA